MRGEHPEADRVHCVLVTIVREEDIHLKSGVQGIHGDKREIERQMDRETT